jgi:RNA polymerase sigma-70 factor (ECF subfamily)
VKDELTLLAGVRRLDPQALAETHDKYYPAIFKYIAYKVGNQETAEDLTSEVFVRLLDAVRDRHAPQNTLRGWLYSVASHIVADYHRKQYRTQEVALMDTIESSVSGPAEQTSKKQTLETLSEALKELTEEQQEVIALRYGYEMPIKDVAEMIGKSEGAVKQLQARAIAALARRMTPESSF